MSYLVDFFHDLPDEILLHVFDFLDTSSIRTCHLVCRRWLINSRIALKKSKKIECLKFSCEDDRTECLMKKINNYDICSLLLLCRTHYKTQIAPLKMIVNFYINFLKWTNSDEKLARNRSDLAFIGSVSTCLCKHPNQQCCAILFPRTRQYEVERVLIPLQDIYVRQYLPLPRNEDKPRLFLFVENSTSGGRLCHIILALRQQYGDNICIVGCSSGGRIAVDDSVFRLQNLAGLLFLGDVDCRSCVIPTENLSNVDDQDDVFRECLDKMEPLPTGQHKAVFLFSSGSLTTKNTNLTQFSQRYSKHISWTTHNGVYGCDFLSPKSFNIPGGRDYFNRSSTVILLISVN